MKTETRSSFHEVQDLSNGSYLYMLFILTSVWTSECLLMIWFSIFYDFLYLLESSGSTALFSLQVAIFLIQRNRHALIGRAIDDHDMQRVLEFLKSDPVSFCIVISELLRSKFVKLILYFLAGCRCSL